jgi:hypothetical protein
MFLLRMFLPRISRQEWRELERQVDLLHQWCAGQDIYRRRQVTVGYDFPLSRYVAFPASWSLNLCSSLTTITTYPKSGAFSLDPCINTVVLLQDGSIAVRSYDGLQYVRIDRSTLSPKRFKEVARAVENCASLLEATAS